jgi:hypothetical protein
LIDDLYWEIRPVTQVTVLFFDHAHATFVAQASPIQRALAAWQGLFKEFGDER